MGKDSPNIVIGFDTTGTHNIGRDIPLDPSTSTVDQQSGSTPHWHWRGQAAAAGTDFQW
jgi:hypothetical protein